MPWPTKYWFEDALGFQEKDNDYAGNQKRLQDMQQTSSDPTTKLRCRRDDNDNDNDSQELSFGRFSCPTVQELRLDCQRLMKELSDKNIDTRCLQQHAQDGSDAAWRNVSACVLALHTDTVNRDATFQAASQFNCLEFVSPDRTPEEGVTGYYRDHTQGPACAMACAAGTAYRNYLVDVNALAATVHATTTNALSNKGQTVEAQINNLDLVLDKLQNDDIAVVNGYADGPEESLYAAGKQITESSNLNDWSNLIKVGVQHETEVTYHMTPELESSLLQERTVVTQVFCSAVPIGYSRARQDAWQPLAEVALAGAYEATLLVAIRNTVQALLGGDVEKAARCRRVYLTFLGGGVFGNPLEWMHRSIQRAKDRVAVFDIPLSVALVHHGPFDDDDVKLVDELNSNSGRLRSHDQQE